MKTGTFVAATAGAGVIGGIVGALVFLTFFAASFAPKAEPRPPAPTVEFQFTPEEEAELRKVSRRLDELSAALDALRRERSPGIRPPASPSAPAPGAAPTDEAGLQANETAAIATLRNLTSCQAQVQTSGKIDCDNDGIGEYGTFQEMTGTVGVRKGFIADRPPGSDFSVQGTVMNPAIMAPSMANVDGEGRVSKNGYYYKIFLPDNQNPARFVHETAGPGLSGGSSRIGVDLSETTWCCYAWPQDPGKTGRRAFFVNQNGDVMQSTNERAKHGSSGSFDPLSAFRGEGITSQIAVGTAGRDGDMWKVTN